MSISTTDMPKGIGLRVLIIDDHRLVTESLSKFLHDMRGFEVCSATELSEGLAILHEEPTFDAILIDVVMPGTSGLSGIDATIKAAAGTPVVIFSGNVTDELVRQSIQQGARGFIPRSFPLKALATAIELIAGGEMFVPADFTLQAAPAAKSPGALLNDRELAVLRRIADGKTNKVIAHELKCTEASVKMHVRSICQKLQAENRAHAVVKAKERFLI